VSDILITSRDNLKGFAEPIRSVFPESKKQICIVHQIRNFYPYVVWKGRKVFVAGMKAIYSPLNSESSALALDHLEASLGQEIWLCNQQLA
jgi:transposase-like protein